MTRNEKKQLINNIRRTIIWCYVELNNIHIYDGYEKDFLFVGLDLDQIRKELKRIASDLDCDSMPDFKLTAYSARTLTILEDILSAKMTLQDIKGA